MNTFTRKGYGRIYVTETEDINKVKAIIKEIDEFEYDYLPKHLITVFSDYPAVVYTGKFDDLDLNLLTAICMDRSIPIFCFDAGHNDYVCLLYTSPSPRDH
jgi:hypothetical protein